MLSVGHKDEFARLFSLSFSFIAALNFAELIFVPREGSKEREDWGYLLGMMYSAENDRT